MAASGSSLTSYMTDYLTDQAVAAIHANRNRPFFLYLAYNAPHTPLQASKADYDALPQIADHRTRVYAAMIRALDRGVGAVMADAQGAGARPEHAGDLHQRQWRRALHRAARHQPAVSRVEGDVLRRRGEGAVLHALARDDQAGHDDRRTGQPFRHLRDRERRGGRDAYPPIARSTASTCCRSSRGRKTGVPHNTLFWRSGAYRVVRDGDWKLQLLDLPRAALLYDMKADPTERRDVAALHPDVVARLTGLIAQHDRDSVKPAWPSLIRSPIAIDRPLGDQAALRAKPISTGRTDRCTNPTLFPEDGRRRRSQTSRDKIVAAMLELVAEGRITPSADEVAARAGSACAPCSGTSPTWKACMPR